MLPQRPPAVQARVASTTWHPKVIVQSPAAKLSLALSTDGQMLHFRNLDMPGATGNHFERVYNRVAPNTYEWDYRIGPGVVQIKLNTDGTLQDGGLFIFLGVKNTLRFFGSLLMVWFGHVPNYNGYSGKWSVLEESS